MTGTGINSVGEASVGVSRFRDPRVQPHSWSEELSRREREVLSGLGQGMSNKEISLVLGISPRTVQKHLQLIYYWLDVETRAKAIAKLNSLMTQSGAR